MNPSANNESGLNLPRPVEQMPAAGQQPEAAPAAVEQQPVVQQQAPPLASSAQPAAVPIAANPVPAAPFNDVAQTTQGVVPIVTDDGDLIEKEWVNKAKAIVERNRDDPYKQSEELTVFKADYMKKRYDKTIKVSK